MPDNISLNPQTQDALRLGVGLKPDTNKVFQSYMSDYDKFGKQIGEARGAQEKETQDLLKRRQDAIASRDATLAVGPQTGPLPSPPKIEQADITNGFSALLALAALGGMASRQPLTASLRSMTGLMQGIQEGNAAKYDQAYKSYEANYKAAAEKNKEMLSEYEKVLKRKDMSIDDIDKEMHLLDLKWQNVIGESLRRQHGVTEAINAYEKLLAAQQHADEAYKRIQGQHEQHRENAYKMLMELERKRQEEAAKEAAAAGKQNVAERGVAVKEKQAGMPAAKPAGTAAGKWKDL